MGQHDIHRRFEISLDKAISDGAALGAEVQSLVARGEWAASDPGADMNGTDEGFVDSSSRDEGAGNDPDGKTWFEVYRSFCASLNSDPLVPQASPATVSSGIQTEVPIHEHIEIPAVRPAADATVQTDPYRAMPILTRDTAIQAELKFYRDADTQTKQYIATDGKVQTDSNRHMQHSSIQTNAYMQQDGEVQTDAAYYAESGVQTDGPSVADSAVQTAQYTDANAQTQTEQIQANRQVLTRTQPVAIIARQPTSTPIRVQVLNRSQSYTLISIPGHDPGSRFNQHSPDTPVSHNTTSFFTPQADRIRSDARSSEAAPPSSPRGIHIRGQAAVLAARTANREVLNTKLTTPGPADDIPTTPPLPSFSRSNDSVSPSETGRSARGTRRSTITRPPPNFGDRVYANLERTKALLERWERKKSLTKPSTSEETFLPIQTPTCPPDDEPGSYLNPYFEDLVDLSIYGYRNNIPGLSQAVHREWQRTNVTDEEAIPGINIVKKAFEYLPVSDPLCRYLILFYSYHWNTAVHSEIEDYVPKGLAFEKFLFGIAYTRCWLLDNWALITLQNWCQFHQHETMSELKICEAKRDRIVTPHLKQELNLLYKNYKKCFGKDALVGPSGPMVDERDKRKWLRPKGDDADGGEIKTEAESSKSAGKRKSVAIESSSSEGERSFVGKGKKRGVAKVVKKTKRG